MFDGSANFEIRRCQSNQEIHFDAPLRQIFVSLKISVTSRVVVKTLIGLVWFRRIAFNPTNVNRMA